MKLAADNQKRSILHGPPFYYIGESLRSVFLFAQRGRGSSVAQDSPHEGHGREGKQRGEEGGGGGGGGRRSEVTPAVVLLTDGLRQDVDYRRFLP